MFPVQKLFTIAVSDLENITRQKLMMMMTVKYNANVLLNLT